MARGRDAHDARVAAVAALGRNLSRRAGSKCELCGESGSLKVVEVPPVGDEPEEEAAAMFCERCRTAIDAKRLDATDLRFLEGSVWSEVVPVKLTAIRLLRRLDAAWARDTLDGLWLDDELQAKLDS